MTRSRRHTPIRGISTCPSEKDDKRFAHRHLRARTRQWLTQVEAQDWDADGPPPPHVRETSDPWNMGKDGKWWLGGDPRDARRWLRK